MDNFNEGCAFALVLVLISLVVFLVQAAIGLWLWGMIAVDIFGLPALTYWQMYGLIWLVHLIFPSNSLRTSGKD